MSTQLESMFKIKKTNRRFHPMTEAVGFLASCRKHVDGFIAANYDKIYVIGIELIDISG
jgi:hypothetical protein